MSAPQKLDLYANQMGIVDRAYTMDPKTEILIPNGGDLEEGMVVLIAAAINRWSILDLTQANIKDMPSIRTVNRWCTITNLEVIRNTVIFTGVYDDGEQIKRKYPTHVGWLAKWQRSSVEKDQPISGVPQVLEGLVGDKSIPECVYPNDMTMNAHVEYYEPDGSKLENGMVVMLHDPGEENKYPRDVTNRWCRVSNVGVVGDLVIFTGVYADGSTFLRQRKVSTAWLVKRDSVPKQLRPATEAEKIFLRAGVERIVLEALEAQRNGNEAIVVLAREAADKIVPWVEHD